MLFTDPAFEWNFFFERFDIEEKSKAKILILVDDELDLDSLSTIKSFVFTSKGVAKVRATATFNFNNKMYDSYLKNKIKDLDKHSRFCFLLSSNIRVESAILNIKLRSKHLARNTSVFSLGLNFNSSLPSEFVNLNLSKVIDFFEGKSQKLSKLFLASKNPLFFLGSNLKNRFGEVHELTAYLKGFMPSSIVFVLEESCNSSGLRLINIKSLSSKDISNSELLISIDLKDTLFIRDSLNLNKMVESFSLSSHISDVISNFDLVAPTNNHNETEGTFMNLEGRPQKTMRLSKKVESVKSVFTAIRNNIINAPNFFHFIEEFSGNPNCFSFVENKFLNWSENRSRHFLMTKVSLYPTIPLAEDFYTKNTFCKKSLTMLKRSQEIRASSTNFL